jgi:PEP-CTERM motif
MENDRVSDIGDFGRASANKGESFMRLRIYKAVALLALAVVILPAAARADTITPMFFDGFQGDKGDVLDSKLVNWNVTSGSIDVLSAGNVCGAAGSASNCLDLDGTGALAGTIQTKQSFVLDPGTYRLSFDLAGANRAWTGSALNTVNVSFGSFYTEAFTLARYDPFQTFTRDITVGAAGTAKIGFAHEGADWIGLLLDNVSLAKVTFDPAPPEVIPTPEPGSWELTTLMLGLAVWGFRKTTTKMEAHRG